MSEREVLKPVGWDNIVLGLVTYGHKVMSTVGERITKLTFSRGFSAQVGATFTILLAAFLGVTVSTTHTLIGAVMGESFCFVHFDFMGKTQLHQIGVALADGFDKINGAMVKRIVLSWGVTMPASAFFAMSLFYLVGTFE